MSISEYHSHTLLPGNFERLSLLPCFPSQVITSTEMNQQEKTLLLSNIPVTMLSTSQLECRKHGAFICQFEYIENKKSDIPSFMKFIYKNFIFNMSKKLKVDESIIDFNLTRLNEVTIKSVLNCTNQANSNNINYNLNFAYHMHEWPIALEIFLQIDVDTFFMKTCSFRGSHARCIDVSINNSTEGLFCIDKPDIRYLMLPCNNTNCPCCYQSLDVSRRHEPSVQLALKEPYRFVNGYQVYLNCHAACKTQNFIYVLTCPCGQFDFIGSSHNTNESFKDVLLYHRRQSVRILHEFLLGEKIIKRTLVTFERAKTLEENKADKMYLYQHLTECYVAVQLLLNHCAHYWPFIPMSIEEAQQEDDSLQKKLKISNFDSQFCSPYERTDQEVEWCLANLPETPTNTRFSRLQMNKQRAFFKNGSDLLFLPVRHLDIFNMGIVFVLPDDCSPLLCHMIESLLTTHAECKLNRNGHLIINNRLLSEIKKSCNDNSCWYKNLVGRVYKD